MPGSTAYPSYLDIPAISADWTSLWPHKPTSIANRVFAGRKTLGKNINRRLAAWTKGVTAEALKSVSERRGSAHVPVNAAYTSQTCHQCGAFGRRSGDRLHCTRCGVVWQADVNPRSTSCTEQATPTSPC